jgi:hypothetical protein
MINITLKCQGENICKIVHIFHHYPTWFLVPIFVHTPICLPTTNIIVKMKYNNNNNNNFKWGIIFLPKTLLPNIDKKIGHIEYSQTKE